VHYNCFYRFVTVIYSFIVVIFLLISMHFIHLFSILLPVCFNKFSVQCSVRRAVTTRRLPWLVKPGQTSKKTPPIKY